jgi:hypothetical protein
VKPIAFERKADTHIINGYSSFFCFLSSDFFGEPFYYLLTPSDELRRVVLFTEIIPLGCWRPVNLETIARYVPIKGKRRLVLTIIDPPPPRPSLTIFTL